MKLKTDENLPIEVAAALRDAGFDACTVLDQRMQGDPDSSVAFVCKREQRVLVTLDLDFADVRAYPPSNYPGIVVLRPRNQAKPTVLDLIARLIPLLTTQPLAGNLWIMEENRLRIREGFRNA